MPRFPTDEELAEFGAQLKKAMEALPPLQNHGLHGMPAENASGRIWCIKLDDLTYAEMKAGGEAAVAAIEDLRRENMPSLRGEQR